MDGLLIVVSDLTEINPKQVIQWSEPLKPEQINSIPIFEAKTLQELNIILALYEGKTIILTNSSLDSRFQTYAPYSIVIMYLNGTERRFLITPPANQIDWNLMEPALDRLEEIL